MRIVLITQNERVFLPRSIRHLLSRLDSPFEVVAAVVLAPSPFGKKKSNFDKILTTLNIFGIKFFVLYAMSFLKNIIAGQSVLQILNQRKIKILRLKKSINAECSVSLFKSLNPDLLISISGNEIFKAEVLSIPKSGTLNLHTALLPKYRGLMPTFWALKNQEVETGVSVFFMDEGIDTGPIIVQKKVRTDGLSQSQLIEITKALGMEAIVEAVLLINDKLVVPIENNDTDSSYFSFPTREDVKGFLSSGARFF